MPSSCCSTLLGVEAERLEGCQHQGCPLPLGVHTGVTGWCCCPLPAPGRHEGVKLQELLCGGSSHPLLAPCGAEGGDGGTRGFLRRHVVPAPRLAFG